MKFTRRHALGLLALSGVAAIPGALRAEDGIVELKWDDLAPESGGTLYESLKDLGIVEHDGMPPVFEQDTDAAVTTKFNGKRVKLPGYVVPLDLADAGVTEFLLVPYVGACIHVPPPPPNQIVFVQTAEPFKTDGYFEPVYVTGILGTVAVDAGIASIGYTLEADTIERYEG